MYGIEQTNEIEYDQRARDSTFSALLFHMGGAHLKISNLFDELARNTTQAVSKNDITHVTIFGLNFAINVVKMPISLFRMIWMVASHF